jgi:hypothetical protein
MFEPLLESLVFSALKMTCLVVLLHNVCQSTSLVFPLEMCMDLTHTNMVALQLKLIVPLLGSPTIDNSLFDL